ncbi:DNA polymerase IV [Phenylobacterium sp. Root77]|jgi:DNA polymerase-4|uniref:DNA polymerase IV n=1 Tax=unclassified Phenylobacterium TaxID=2640670 RepID=UPI000700A282|nr:MULTISPECIES: DNA polymerase IV [unclassified Phenylobacterium]KQW71356.1 DNA polymerase IV [Phenylobacterium sp. Root1277]KQW94277.1 DNA polymerase IV [Phenylobacterium sp. Root1290]KRC43970.1 DNA polymerase IV [Phenylobacterium sp. Root77]
MTALCRDCFRRGAFERRCPACGSPRIVVHQELEKLSIAHMDCDAFYASVEKRDDPSLRDQALIVGGGKRGVVTTCCYIARMSGVRSAMPMFKARQLCPQAVILKPDFTKYRTESRRIMEMVRDLTPLVQPLSLDEAWMDLSGTERLHGAPPAETLSRLQARIEAEIGITVSIGLAPNKFLAKIASDLDKPRGFSVIGAAEAQSFLAPKPVGIIPGVGPAMVKSLEGAGLPRVGDIARTDLKVLAQRFGAQGLRLHDLAHGRDNRPVNPHEERKGISAETTFNDDLTSLADLEDKLAPLCDRVARQARAGQVAGRVVTFKLRHTDFKIITRRRVLPVPTQTAKTLFAVGREMLAKEADGRAWRLIGIGMSELIDADAVEHDFFADAEHKALVEERVVDKLRARFGPDAVTSGRALGAKRTSHD